MTIKDIKYYNDLYKKVEKEISDLWEVGEKSKSKEERLEEIKLIIIGLNFKEVMEEQLIKIRYYERLLEQNHISYLH